MMTRRKLLTGLAVGTLGAATGLTAKPMDSAVETRNPEWQGESGSSKYCSDELFDAWVQDLLQSVARQVGVPYERLGAEHSELRATHYKSARASILVGAPATGRK